MSDYSGKVLQVAVAIAAYGVLLFYLGFVVGDKIDNNEMMSKFESWEPKEQKEFLIEATKDKKTLKRSIAEDWCAINKNTQRVCWNARLINPIRGGK